MTEGVGQEIVVETAGNSGLCGVRFTVGESHILMGKYMFNVECIGSLLYKLPLNNLFDT